MLMAGNVCSPATPKMQTDVRMGGKFEPSPIFSKYSAQVDGIEYFKMSHS